MLSLYSDDATFNGNFIIQYIRTLITEFITASNDVT
jgi:hypothetical protein